MAFDSLNYVLGSLDRYQPQEQKQLKQVVRCWAEIVGEVVAAQAQPVGIQRQVLRVATSSSAWAQNLVFERQRILEKLNQHLLLPLTDIRFSTVQWQQTISSYAGVDDQSQLWQQHPSRRHNLPAPKLSEAVIDTSDPVLAFKHWAQWVRSQSHNLPLCPHCHCPTPPGELERWHSCAPCAAQRWE